MISISRFCRSEGNLKKRFEERKKRRKANLSHHRSVPQGCFAGRRRRPPSTVRVNTTRLSVQIPSHRPPSLALKSCELFDPNERPPVRPPPPPPLQTGTMNRDLYLGMGAGETTSFCLWTETKLRRFIFIYFLKIHNKTTSF